MATFDLIESLKGAVTGTETVYLISSGYPAGAPHATGYREIVDAALPSDVAAGSRLVLSNPFGANVACAAEAELFVSNGWHSMGYGGDAGLGESSYGTRAICVQEGVVIISGKSGVGAGNPALCGASHPLIAGWGIASAPCRVRLTRLKGIT